MQNQLNQAFQLHASGNIQEAIDLYLQLLPSQQENEHLLFLLGTAYAQTRNSKEAASCLQKSLDKNPLNPAAYNNLGLALCQLNKLDDALFSYERAIALQLDFAEAFYNRGNVLSELKRFDEAMASYNRAIAIKPDYADAFSNRGNILKELKRFDEALFSYAEALRINPDYADALNNRGNVLKELKRLDEALASYDRAITIKHDYAVALNNRGNVLKELKRLDEALASYDRAITIKHDYAEALNNRGNVLNELKRLDEALLSYAEALRIKPDYAEVLNNQGVVLKELKRLDEALLSYSEALRIKPNFDFLLGLQQHLKMHLCQWDDFDVQLKSLSNKILQKEKVSLPFPLLSLIDMPEIHKLASQLYIDEKFPAPIDVPKFSRSSTNAKIRIAYYSADFCSHATMHLIAEIFEQHDRDRFEIVAFSFGPITNDAWQLKAKNVFDQFINCHTKSDEEVALLSQNLAIDIAVDLKGFTTDARTGIFAYRAAPIQVNFLGYPGTMGAKYIDYLIADEFIIPKELQSFYSEKIAYLPDCYQPNCRSREISSDVITKKALGLPENVIVFCSFNNNYKITPPVFSSWLRILKEVKGSVLWLLATNPTAEKNLKRYLEQDGIEPNRLIFAKPIPIGDHLNRMQMSDIMLDTFPCGAHTTCSDAIRMGLPIVTMVGESFASRVAASLLTSVGLPELIAQSLIEYEHIAIELASDQKKIEEVRSKLKQKVMSSSLFDPQSFTRNLESLYDTMHKRYKQGLVADHLFTN